MIGARRILDTHPSDYCNHGTFPHSRFSYHHIPAPVCPVPLIHSAPALPKLMPAAIPATISSPNSTATTTHSINRTHTQIRRCATDA